MSKDSYSVVIATYNRPAVAARLVRYLTSDLGWQVPVIVVEQTEDAGASLRRQLDPWPDGRVSLLVDDGRGSARARNRGVREATSEWLIFFDDDSVPVRDYLENLRQALTQNPWVDAVQGGIFYEREYEEYLANPEDWSARFSPNAARSRERLPPSRDGVMWFTGSVRANYSALTIGTGSCNLVIRRDTYLRVGGFDENMRALEDRELGLRLWWYGYRTLYSPRPAVFHLHHPIGGMRHPERRPFRQRFEPRPREADLAYLYVKWFPGIPLATMALHQVVTSSLTRPWLMPLHALRMWKAVRDARSRLLLGPRYVESAEPLPRPD